MAVTVQQDDSVERGFNLGHPNQIMKNNINPFKCKKHHMYQGKYKPRGACDPCWMMYIWSLHHKGSVSDYIYGLVRRGFEINTFNPIVNLDSKRRSV